MRYNQFLTSEATDLRYRMILATIGAMALVLRLSPLLRHGTNWAMGADSGGYVQMADGLRSGCGFARKVGDRCDAPEIVRPPGYPLFLAAIPGFRNVIAVQAALSALTCILLAAFVRPRWGSPAALLSAFLLAIDLPSAHAASQILSDSLFQTFVLCAVLCALAAADRAQTGLPAAKLALLSGLLASIAVMVRPNGLCLIAVLPLFFCTSLISAWPRRLLLASLAVAIPLAAVVTWTLRNKAYTGVLTFSFIGSCDAYYYKAAGLQAYRTGGTLVAAQADFARDIGAQSASPWANLRFYEEMNTRAPRLIFRHPIDFLIVTSEDFLFLLTAPERRPFQPLEMGSDAGTHRLRRMFQGLVVAPFFTLRNVMQIEFDSSIVLCALALLQLSLTSFTLVGVGLALVGLRTRRYGHWHSMVVLFIAVLALLAPASGPEANARLRLPVIPLLIMLSAIGWIGSPEVLNALHHDQGK